MMLTVNPYQQYRTQGVMTASPTELIVMLYDGLIKRVQLAKLSLEEERLEDAHRSFIRGQEILEELVASLDMAYELSHQLNDLYAFCHDTLIEANRAKDPAKLQDVVDIIASLREAWVVVAKNTKVHMPLAVDE